MAVYTVHNGIRKKATIWGLITMFFLVFLIVSVASLLFFFIKPSVIGFGVLGIGNAVLYFILYFVQDFNIDDIKTALPDIIINN